MPIPDKWRNNAVVRFRDLFYAKNHRIGIKMTGDNQLSTLDGTVTTTNTFNKYCWKLSFSINHALDVAGGRVGFGFTDGFYHFSVTFGNCPSFGGRISYTVKGLYIYKLEL